VTAVVLSAGSAISAVVNRETIQGVLDTASTTVQSAIEELVKCDETPLSKTKLRAQLKTAKQLQQEEKVAEKNKLGKLSDVEFSNNLVDTTTGEFEPFDEGPDREP